MLETCGWQNRAHCVPALMGPMPGNQAQADGNKKYTFHCGDLAAAMNEFTAKTHRKERKGRKGPH